LFLKFCLSHPVSLIFFPPSSIYFFFSSLVLSLKYSVRILLQPRLILSHFENNVPSYITVGSTVQNEFLPTENDKYWNIFFPAKCLIYINFLVKPCPYIKNHFTLVLNLYSWDQGTFSSKIGFCLM
jgi:hypothetical protein